VGSDQLADGVAEQEVGLDSPGLEETEEGDLESKEGGLGEGGLVEQGGVFGAFGGEEDLAQRAVEFNVGRDSAFAVPRRSWAQTASRASRKAGKAS
jgi:hypothetical protein